MTSLAQITRQMQLLETDINRQQQYIATHGESNDLNTDEQWEQYKEDAAYNLRKWDAMKIARDQMKESAYGV